MRTTMLSWNGDGFEGGARIDCAALTLYFGPHALIASERFQTALRAACPNAHLVGCSAETLVRNSDLIEETASAVAIEFAATRIAIATTDVSAETSTEAGAALARILDAPDLAGVFVLSDSLNVEGAHLVEGMRANLQTGVPISGGLASDGPAFKLSSVGVDGAPRPGMAAAIGFYGDRIRVTQGCAHGWDDFGPPRRITRAEGRTLFELDGEPALDLYERYLGADAADLPGSALRFPLLVREDGGHEFVRTVLDVDQSARSLTFASTVKTGWSARLMRGAFDHLTQGAADAAEQAMRGAETDDERGLALLVSCIGRRILMGGETADEIEAVADVFGARFNLFGFYSHGEISTVSNDAFCGLHNQSMTILTIREAPAQAA